LLDEKGVDVNATTADEGDALHHADSLDILIALLDRGGDPILSDLDCQLPLILQAQCGSAEIVARLLEDPRVRATINMQDMWGNTALHHACKDFRRDVGGDTAAICKVNLLLQADANPTITNRMGQPPLNVARQHYPDHYPVIALLKQYPNAQKDAETSLLVKARRLVVVATSNAVAPSYLQARVARGQFLPRVALMPLTDGQTDGEDEEDEEGEEGRKLSTTLAFMCGVGREGMPWDIFRMVMDLLMPSWDPLRWTTGPEPLAHG